MWSIRTRKLHLGRISTYYLNEKGIYSVPKSDNALNKPGEVRDLGICAIENTQERVRTPNNLHEFQCAYLF